MDVNPRDSIHREVVRGLRQVLRELDVYLGGLQWKRHERLRDNPIPARSVGRYALVYRQRHADAERVEVVDVNLQIIPKQGHAVFERVRTREAGDPRYFRIKAIGFAAFQD